MNPGERARFPNPSLHRCARYIVFLAIPLVICGHVKTASSPTKTTQLPSAIVVTANPKGPVTLKTPATQFDVLPAGHIKASLMEDGKWMTLDEPEAGAAATSDYLVVAGNEVRDFQLDFAHVKVSEAHGRMCSRSKRIEISGRSSAKGVPSVAKTLALEVYDDFPALAVTTVTYKNAGNTEAMYYAFFAAQPSTRWKGEIELRGLAPGKYRVFDYVNSKDLRTVDGEHPKFMTEFTDHLVTELS